MSFPRLKLTAGTTIDTISDITIVHDATNGGATPVSLTRGNYSITRDFQTLNVAQSPGSRFPDVPYNRVRLIHSWTGYCDVLTESVAVTSLSSEQVRENVALIKTAVFLVGKIPFDIEVFDSVPLGSGLPNLDGIYADAFEQGLFWEYKDGEQTKAWPIKSIAIGDNGDNTSRVTFRFEMQEPWQETATIIDAI